MLVARLARKLLRKVCSNPYDVAPDPQWAEMQRRLAEANTVVDLGCGNHPVNGATAAVDLYMDNRDRVHGGGSEIDIDEFHKTGIRFVNASIDQPLPFQDREFDFAYSHHVFEHVDDPETACREAMRIAKGGVIITPSSYGEIIFGRPYHKWLVMGRNNTLFFFKKCVFEDRPFGNPPIYSAKAGKYIADDSETNPFDMLLNCNGWYGGTEKSPRLARRLRQMYYSHSPILEVVFLWKDSFDVKVFD